MIRLITQFDSENARISLATPTCGCCCSCCCCCCIVSTITTASISARNFESYVDREMPSEPQKAKRARSIGFWFPIGLVLIAIMFIPFADYSNLNIQAILIPSLIIYLCIITSLLNTQGNLFGIILRVVGISILLCVFVVLEIIVVAFTLAFFDFNFNLEYFLLYFIIAIIISGLLISWAFNKKYDRLDDISKTEDAENIDISSNQNEEDINNINLTNNDENEINKDDSSEVKTLKKKCPKCGTENAIDNKRCFYCSNYFKDDDEK